MNGDAPNSRPMRMPIALGMYGTGGYTAAAAKSTNVGTPRRSGIAEMRPHLARVVRVELAVDQQLLRAVLEPARDVGAEIGRGVAGPVPRLREHVPVRDVPRAQEVHALVGTRERRER